MSVSVFRAMLLTLVIKHIKHVYLFRVPKCAMFSSLHSELMWERKRFATITKHVQCNKFGRCFCCKHSLVTGNLSSPFFFLNFVSLECDAIV